MKNIALLKKVLYLVQALNSKGEEMELYRILLLATCLVIAYFIVGALLKKILTPNSGDENSLDPEETKIFIALWPIVIIAAGVIALKEILMKRR